jgi:hypothetical protein
MKLTKYLAAAAAVCVAGGLAWGAGIFQTFAIIGGAAYCAASNVSGAAQGTVTGQGGGVAAAGGVTGTVVCQVTQPAGPATFAGTEVIPMDIYPPGTANIAGGAQTALANIAQLGQGLVLDNVTAGAASTIPNGVMFDVLDTGTSVTTTVTLPAVALEGQMVEIICTGAGGSTSLTVSPNTGQTIKNGPAPGACASGVIYKFRFSAVAGATGGFAANTWIRIQ